MKYILLLCFQLCVFFTFSQKPFEPIPDSLKSQYKFDLKKNFFKSESEFIQFQKEFDQKKTVFDLLLKKTATVKNLEALTLQLSSLEFDFRKMDLYLFLQYATDLTNQKSSAKEDSIYDIMATERSKYLKILKTASASTISNLLDRPSMRPFNYYIQKNIGNKTHELSEENKMILAPFNYLTNGQFYREILNEIPTDTIYTANEKLDLFNDMAKWQNHDVAEVREEGESKLYKSYATAALPLGLKYIEMVKGLNAFARAKKYEDLIDENCDKMSLSKTVLESVFKEIGKNAHIYKTNSNENLKEIGRYVVSDASKLILQSLQSLGPAYHHEASQLLNPKNGRMDIVGGPNRLPLQGAASVYPIGVSTFYAQNYEGYYIDIMLLAHEAGHAIQASLMHQNKVSLLNASGPAYFTESFGKFNEILVAHTLMEIAKEKTEFEFYKAKYVETLLTLFGASTGAVIEYNLIDGISKGTIRKPADLDSVCLQIGKKYSYFIKKPEHKSFWMRQNSNFDAPMHNIHSMMASVISIHYFQKFLKEKEVFIEKYNLFLKNGYTDAPAALLKDLMGIDMNDKDFSSSSLRFIEQEITRLKK